MDEEWDDDPPELSEFDRKLARQAGVITRDQAVAAGMTDAALYARVSSRRWQRVHHGVYATFNGPLPRMAKLWAAALYAGEGAALSHETAAEVLGFGHDDHPFVHVSVPTRRRVRPVPGMRVHRSASLEIARHLSIPATSAERTVIDLTQTCATRDDAIGWISRACSRRVTAPEKLSEVIGTRKKVRWRRELQAALADESDGANFPLEHRYLRDVEDRHGLPTAVRQRRVKRGAATDQQDVHYDGFGLTVELDGLAYHPDETRSADRRRDNAGVRRGEATLRYTWQDVAGTPCDTAREIAEALIRRRWDAAGLRPCSAACPVQSLTA